MSNICCLLDACTAINFIHIDEDDFLLKKIEKLDIHINDVVFDEIRLNVKKGIKTTANKKEIEKIIDQKLSFFRGINSDNGKLLKDTGINYIDNIKTATSYIKKTNGELYSTAYALYLSRINEKKVFFYTDDYPAKIFFSSFFEYQQIGHIKDSVDLLVLLYWLDDKFTSQQLDNLLSDLHHQYAKDVTILKHKLQDYYNRKVNAAFRRSKKDIADNLYRLIVKLDKLEFKGISSLYLLFEINKNRCKDIFEIFKNYNSVLELEQRSSEETLLGKIFLTRNAIKGNGIYKWNDLITS